MGNCFKKPSAKERLLQLDKNYRNDSGHGSGSLYDGTIFDISPTDNINRTNNKKKGPRQPTNPRITSHSA